jgi:hypothetical protein
MPGEVGVQFIALLRRFERTQGLVCGGKVGPGHLTCCLNPAAWILQDKLNTIEKCAGCNEGLATVPGEFGMQFIAL